MLDELKNYFRQSQRQFYEKNSLGNFHLNKALPSELRTDKLDKFSNKLKASGSALEVFSQYQKRFEHDSTTFGERNAKLIFCQLDFAIMKKGVDRIKEGMLKRAILTNHPRAGGEN